MFVTGLVLAAGGSRRLERPKQLLPYRDTSLLGATLRQAGSCGFDQLLVTLGGSAQEVRSGVDLGDWDVVENEQFATGCSSSIKAAIGSIDLRADGLVLLLGDQPGVRPGAVRGVVGAGTAEAIAVCAYADGPGHPLWFGRDIFPDLLALHGDKGVWRLIESGRHAVTTVPVEGSIPPDVDTWAAYRALLAADVGVAS